MMPHSVCHQFPQALNLAHIGLRPLKLFIVNSVKLFIEWMAATLGLILTGYLIVLVAEKNVLFTSRIVFL